MRKFTEICLSFSSASVGINLMLVLFGVIINHQEMMVMATLFLSVSLIATFTNFSTLEKIAQSKEGTITEAPAIVQKSCPPHKWFTDKAGNMKCRLCPKTPKTE